MIKTKNIKTTDMKKFLLFRLVVIAVFCMVSISIKSETNACKLICHCTAQSGAAASLKVLNAETDNEYYRPDVFYINI